jgi:hypothetical protein
MALEAIYVGPEGSHMRVNNGEKNYQKFVSGEPQDVDQEMASILREYDYFVVREKAEEAPTTKKAPAKRKTMAKKK